MYFALAMISALAGCRDPEIFPIEERDGRLSGGINTVFDVSSKAFSREFPTLDGYNLSVHKLGDTQFEQRFVTAPAPVNSGLGPIYNNVSCTSCHHNDGIGVPTTGNAESSLLLRISLPGSDAYGAPLPVPGYGTQLQDKAVLGQPSECSIVISYTYQTFSFPDSETYELQTPIYQLTNLYMPISGGYMLSPRLAPPVFGLGLLESIPEFELLSRTDISDANHDGISGKPNYVWDPATSSVKIGRFGWKANTASILTQVAGAYNQDMGITNSVFPLENTHSQRQFDHLSDDPELPDSLLHAVSFYVQSLAVPARRNIADNDVVKGYQLFVNAKCASCHVPVLTTGVNVAFPQVSNQTIFPYTDLLLHDMGSGLADNRPDFNADANEWRTAPLWGIGLYETVNYPAYYLHDGRARTLIEAIMWHDGEARQSKTFVQQLSKTDRDALLKFLKSL
jgi:CxxC motif-containing protein (DUF1111 family)